MKRFFYPLFVVVFLAGCNADDDDWNPGVVKGNGELESTYYFMDDFYQVEIQDEFFVTLVQDSTWKIELSGESNIIPHITIFVTNNAYQPGILTLKFQDDMRLNPTEKINVVIHHRGLEKVSLIGAGGVTGFNNSNHIHYDLSGSGIFDVRVFCYELDITAAGVGEIYLQGDADESYMTVSGLCDVYAESLNVKRCWSTITASGKAKKYLKVDDELNVDISGTGYIYYSGDPVVLVDISGTGLVQKRE